MQEKEMHQGQPDNSGLDFIEHHSKLNIEGAHAPHYSRSYDIRTAPQNYLSIATVLAGFAFTAAVLVIQVPAPNLSEPKADILRNLATVSFIVAFLGCTLSAFTCSMVTGEMSVSRRSYTVALLGGVGLVIPSSLIFWGVVVLLRSYLDSASASLSHQVFLIFSALPPLYLSIFAMRAHDGFDVNVPNWQQVMQVLVPSYTPLLFIFLIKYVINQSFAVNAGVLQGVVDVTEILVSLCQAIMPLSVILMIGNSVWIILAAHKEPSYCLSALASGIWISIHSVVIGFLLLML